MSDFFKLQIEDKTLAETVTSFVLFVVGFLSVVRWAFEAWVSLLLEKDRVSLAT